MAAILDSKRLSLHGEDPSSELTAHPDYILSSVRTRTVWRA